MPSLPDRLPLLSPGSHLTPSDGACLMELVSVLAGLAWSDRPRCTDPTLAAVARVTNDDTGFAARQDLAVLAADLVGRRGDPTTLAPAVVVACLDAAIRHAPRASLRRHRRRAIGRLNAPARAPGHRLLAYLYVRGPAQHAISAAVLAVRRLARADRDAALRDMLVSAMAAVPPVSPVARAPRRPRGSVVPGRM